MNNESLLTARLPVQALDSAPVVQGSAVAWSAVVAGATGSAALSLILLILGTGLGLSSVSPWVDRGASASALGASTILWITLTQIAAAGMGGYLAGRLRTRWAGTHSDEVYFRDTAHGFLAWALATIVTAALLTSTIAGIVGAGAKAGAVVAAGATATAATVVQSASGEVKSNAEMDSTKYFVDTLFRKEPNSSAVASASVADQRLPTSEVARILAVGLASGSMAADDTKYVAQLVSQSTGLPQADAEKRVGDGFARMQTKIKEAEVSARDAADKARKVSAYAALWLFVSLLIGAFCASLAATYGGRQRDLT